MLGAIIGDIVGSCYEFHPTNDYNFDLFPAGANFTDDTICTIAVADAILRGYTYGKSIHYWCNKYPSPKGCYGGRFAQWVASKEPQPYGSFGNGSAMRVSAVGWRYKDETELAKQAALSAACTHNHKYGIAGAQAVAFAIHDCRELRLKNMGKEISREDILHYGLWNAMGCLTEGFESPLELDIEKYRNKFDETCQGTVPVAIAIILESNGFEDALRRAVSLGADADTLGAIVGSIAEALWGIPSWMKEKALTYLPHDMRKVLREFRATIHGHNI